MAVRCLPRGRICAVKHSPWQPRTWTHFRLSSTVPSVDTCPSPTCSCAEMPELDIDRMKPLVNTISPHAKHVVVHTGREDWAKRIEEDEEIPNIAKELKALLGFKGPFHDVGALVELRCRMCIVLTLPFSGNVQQHHGHQFLLRPCRKHLNISRLQCLPQHSQL